MKSNIESTALALTRASHVAHVVNALNAESACFQIIRDTTMRIAAVNAYVAAAGAWTRMIAAGEIVRRMSRIGWE
jgi:hypothetical protein